MPDLRPLLSPDSVAIIGAAADSSLRGRLTQQLVEHGFDGRIYPVTRSQTEVLGHKAYAAVGDIPEAADLAIILVPAAYVVSTIEQCAARGIPAAVVISSGFAEEKSEEAAARDQALRAIAKRTGMVIAGPNSEGLVNPLRPLVATFSPVFHDPKEPLLPQNSRAKPIAVSCQSGALTFAFLSRGRDRQLRFTYQISAGNQTVLEAHDYLDWVLDALAKVGRSDAGRRAAASHTGSLARAGMADDAIFRHHGIIRGEDLDHMVDVASAFAYCPLPRGNRVAVITGSGGSAVWMADILSAHGLELPVIEENLQRRIMALLPSYASAQNPIDATAQAIGEVGYAPMVELVAQSERIDTILLISSLANPERAKKLAAELAGITASLDKPILLSTYTTATPASIAAIAGAGIPCYTSMPSCARAIKALVDYGRFREKLARRKPVEATAPALRDEVTLALAAAGPVLTEVASKALLARYGVPLPPEALATSEDEAIAAASRIGSAVALKAQSPDILHKTEAGAVMLGLSGDGAVREGYRTVLARAKAAYPNAKIDGVLVQAMAKRGREMILGVTRDPDFGPMLMVGLGGIHVEVLKDVAFGPVPLGADDALDLIGQLKGAALLDAVRGEPAADRDALTRLMVALSRFAADHADAIAEIDLNPVIVHAAGEGLTIVDALIVKR